MRPWQVSRFTVVDQERLTMLMKAVVALSVLVTLLGAFTPRVKQTPDVSQQQPVQSPTPNEAAVTVIVTEQPKKEEVHAEAVIVAAPPVMAPVQTNRSVMKKIWVGPGKPKFERNNHQQQRQ